MGNNENPTMKMVVARKVPDQAKSQWTNSDVLLQNVNSK